MKSKLLIGALLSVLIAACRGEALPTQAPIESVADFEQALLAAGVQAEQPPGAAPELPGLQVQTWKLSGESVYIVSWGETSGRGEALDELTAADSPFLLQGQELQVWERETFMVVYPGSEGGVVLLIDGLLGDPSTYQVSGPDEPYPPAISAAQLVLSEELDVPPSQVSVIDYEPALWPDSCLGLSGGGETCEKVETSGWRIELRVDGQNYLLRSDAIGGQIRRDN
ncbi:MAG: hypothetical protein PVI04_05300 [Anaerolineales bacterium]